MEHRHADLAATAVVAAILLAGALVGTGRAAETAGSAPVVAVPPPGAPPGAPAPDPDPVIAAAGDIACKPGSRAKPDTCQQRATADLLDDERLAAILTLG